jgi:hypothetical protein
MGAKTNAYAAEVSKAADTVAKLQATIDAAHVELGKAPAIIEGMLKDAAVAEQKGDLNAAATLISGAFRLRGQTTGLLNQKIHAQQAVSSTELSAFHTATSDFNAYVLNKKGKLGAAIQAKLKVGSITKAQGLVKEANAIIPEWVKLNAFKLES